MWASTDVTTVGARRVSRYSNTRGTFFFNSSCNVRIHSHWNLCLSGYVKTWICGAVHLNHFPFSMACHSTSAELNWMCLRAHSTDILRAEGWMDHNWAFLPSSSSARETDHLTVRNCRWKNRALTYFSCPRSFFEPKIYPIFLNTLYFKP